VASRPGTRRNKKNELPEPTAGFKRDKLDRKQLKALYGVTAAQLRIDDELMGVFTDAWEGGWEGEQGRARFWAALENTNWWRTNSQTMREYLFASADPDSADFQELMADSMEFVRGRAMQLGVNISEDRMRELAEQNLMLGWGKSGRTVFLDRAITEGPQDGMYGGDIGANARALRSIAAANGVQYDDNWYQSAGLSVARQLSSGQYWEQQIRDQAASTFPVFREQILAGVNVQDIASPYIRTMAEMWDLAPTGIKLTDPTLLGALTNYDDKGNPNAMNLGDFRRMLRQDERWLSTSGAQNEVASVGSQILKMFGLVG